MRDVVRGTEVPLEAYQSPRQMDEGLLLRVLKGLATRNYEACAETVPQASVPVLRVAAVRERHGAQVGRTSRRHSADSPCTDGGRSTNCPPPGAGSPPRSSPGPSAAGPHQEHCDASDHGDSLRFRFPGLELTRILGGPHLLEKGRLSVHAETRPLSAEFRQQMVERAGGRSPEALALTGPRNVAGCVTSVKDLYRLARIRRSCYSTWGTIWSRRQPRRRCPRSSTRTSPHTPPPGAYPRRGRRRAGAPGCTWCR